MWTLQALCVLGAGRCSLVEFMIWALIFLIFKANLYYRKVIFQTNFKILLRINNLAHQFETPTTLKSMRECNLWSLGMLRPHLRLKLKNSIEGRQRTVGSQGHTFSIVYGRNFGFSSVHHEFTHTSKVELLSKTNTTDCHHFFVKP